jgi:hypothetical protein
MGEVSPDFSLCFARICRLSFLMDIYLWQDELSHPAVELDIGLTIWYHQQ